VRIFTALGGPLATWPFANSPNALAVHAGTGTAWIADEALGGVVRVDRAGTMLADAGAFTNPQDVAVTADGGAWVVDAAVGTVTRIAANGARGAVAALGGDPRRAAVDALDGSVWVTRFAADEVIKLSVDGEILARTALGPGPFAIDIDEARNLVWVGLDTGNAIVALDRRVGGEVRRVDSVPRPRGLVVADRTGEVWVAAIATGEVVRVSSAGVVLGRTGGFAAPFDVRLDPGPRSLPPAPARTGSRW
jgi:DNA-binding beta-propeller fold protein YncE